MSHTPFDEPRDGAGARWFGLYPARVVDLVDPDAKGRIKVRFPSFGADGAGALAWATLLTPYADDDQGFEALPEVDSQVVCGFEAGDPTRPYIVGACWNGRRALPEAAASANNLRTLRTRSGSQLQFDDTEGAAKVTLSMRSGHELVLDDQSQEITVRHSNGCTIQINIAGQVSITANSTVEITAAGVNMHAPSVVCDGVLQCQTLIAGAGVISPSYTPGAGERVVSAVLRPDPPWLLAGPWYRWTHPGVPADGRASRPAIQMFSGDDFVQAFLQRPQHSLKADPAIDFVNHFDLVSAAPGGKLAGKIGTMFAVNAAGDPYRPGIDPSPLRARLAPSALRKLFQPSHDRHYLVTCELHCDAPGFPRANRLGVCQAGFVVRRRRSILPAGVTASDVAAQTAPVRTAEADLLELLALAASAEDPRASAALVGAVHARQQALADAAGVAGWDALVALRQSQLAGKRAALDAWYAGSGVSVAIDGWFPVLQGGRPSAMYGGWQPLDAGTELGDVTSGEQTYPMFALVPDPRDTQHDAAGRTLYYGNVPTMSLQHDTRGNARFDDQTTFEVRCFVRRHHACPPKVGRTPDCNGALTWSRATDAFRMAAPFDILGAANRPITIRMPDLRDLAAQVALRPRGALSPVRVIQPQHLMPNTDGTAATGGQVGGGAVCSFSIPLITIIAMFVLTLFLPIVVFLFDLWFLLALRFCIPPSLQASAAVDAALAATPPSVDLDVDGAVTIGATAETADALNALLALSVRKQLQDGTDLPVSLDQYSNNALGTLDQSLTDNASLATGPDATLPPVGTPLVYEPAVASTWSLSKAVTS